ncbi:hypothetical protein QYE76_008333 [Lolium multiflorum]|uniref:Transposase-associated domain-containing protein n=1 Tax=Lolium multiflorum TaxID=4521 RepID=A0AAD8QH08_LOLMU|nr:hypothetical protein QYE76_008333 [Lolium multiflorum]
MDVYCPRCTCMNGEKRPHHVVEDHLHIFGMDRTYVRWVYHGEPHNDPSAGEADLAHTMDGREGEKNACFRKRVSARDMCCADEKKHRVEEVSRFDGRFEDESRFDALWMVGTSRFHAEAMGNENSAHLLQEHGPICSTRSEMPLLGGTAEAETAPLLKWMQNEADEAAVGDGAGTIIRNLYKHEAMGHWVTETAKPSLVKRIATAADEASERLPPSSCQPTLDAYKLKSKDQPGRNHPRALHCPGRITESQLILVATRVVTGTHLKAMFKLPKSIAKDLNLAEGQDFPRHGE